MTVDDVFLGRVGHDLRGELATMVAGVHYLLRYEAGLGETGRQMLERVDGAGKRLKKLLDELEDASWIEGPGERRPARDALSVSGLLHEALASLERSASAREVTVGVSLPADLPDIEGDAELCVAAFEHELDFAIARTPRGGAVSVVAALGAATPAEEGSVVVTMTDAGRPLDEALLARLFEPFVEREALPPAEPGARRRERLGLGLAIARGILAAHGGSLAAAPAPGGQGLRLTSRWQAAPRSRAT